MNRPAALLFAVPALLLSVGCETVETTKPAHLSSKRGLKAESGAIGNKALVKTTDPASLRRYNKVIIEDVKVVQPRNVPAGEQRASRAEAERLAEHFEDVLRKELGAHYQITNRRSSNTLSVRATLTELQPSNPGLFVFNYLPYAAAVTTGVSLATGKTVGAGSTTVEAEVVDSLSRRQVYAIVDRFEGSKFQPAGIEKWGQSESAMRSWARKIRTGIHGAEPVISTKRTSAKKS